MAKYYVCSGSQSLVVQAMDAEGAALWAMHRWVGESGTDDSSLVSLKRFAVDVAAEEIRVSEIGFGRCDAGRFDRQQAWRKYNQLNSALTLLIDKLDSSSSGRL